MYKKLSAPVSIQWELTSWCNQKCMHCYNYWRDKDITINYLDKEQQKVVVREILQNKIFDVCLTGGEPLVVLEYYYDSLMILVNSGVSLGLNTNASMLNSDHIRILKDLGINGLLISLVSSDRFVHDKITGIDGSFERVINGISFAKENGLGISISMVGSKLNKETVLETAELSCKLGAKSFCVTRPSWPLWQKDFTKYSLSHEEILEMFDKAILAHEKFGLRIDTLVPCPTCGFKTDKQREYFGNRGCGSGKSSIIIGSNGDIRPCPQSEESFGSIFDGLKKAWDKMKKYRDDSLIPYYCKKKCQAFPYACHGGCRANSKNVCGSADSEDPMCTKIISTNMVKKLFESNGSNEFLISKFIRYRKEKFGYIAYLQNSAWLPIENSLYELLITSTKIDIGSIKNKLGTTYIEADRLLGILKDRRFIFDVKEATYERNY
ncbi:MAG: radical SAM protein [Caldisericia bacterium]|nr:radical SAM protein [Caldisericia bacterium]